MIKKDQHLITYTMNTKLNFDLKSIEIPEQKTKIRGDFKTSEK